MTDISYSEPEAGIHPGIFSGVEDFEYEDKETGQPEYRWRWNFHANDGTPFDTLTSRSFRPGTNALKLFTGLLGRPPASGDKPNDLIGTAIQIVYGPNKGGKLTVTDVHLDRTAKAAPTTAPDPAEGLTF